MSQLIMFYMWTLLLPYWKFAVFAWSYRWEHYVVLVPVLLHCFLATFYDTHFFLDLFIRGKRMRLWQTFKLTYTFQFLVNAGIFITWPFMPLFVLNFFFYCGLLVSVWIAYKLCRSLVREVREFFNKKQK
ncbi:hypothetical protein BaRGS_00006276 [Batillaria attramentaria]|uniref:Uncharacterized protein n=1 Tax=Batillaria attramentaria TaxID=370345 RepID=A0ABD0LT69_9CAEN